MTHTGHQDRQLPHQRSSAGVEPADPDDTTRFGGEAATWEDKPGHAERTRGVAALLRQALPLRPDMTLLEIGGGTGRLARELVDDIARAVIADVSPGMLEVAAAKISDPRFAGWKTVQFDIENDDLPDERYDLVIGAMTLHHMRDVASVVARCAQLLRPGGWVAFVDLDHDEHGHFHSTVENFSGHHGFTRDTAQHWLEAAGLAEVRVRDAGTTSMENADGVAQDFPMFLVTGHSPRSALTLD